MTASNLTELEEFHRFVGSQLQQQVVTLSPEAALDLFRQRTMATEKFSSSVAAIERALAQAKRGEGIGLDQAIQHLREKHGVPQLVDDE